jgi:Family of unknown function (DUF5317)
VPLTLIIILVLAVAAGFVAHGSLRPFEHLRVHLWGLAVAGLVLQTIPFPHDTDPAAVSGLFAASYLLMIACVWVNRRLPAAGLILIGLALNMTVVVPNGGMPVSAQAVRIAGGAIEELPAAGGSSKHHLMTEDDVLRPLGDVIPGPPPLSDVLSIGDLFLYAGLACFVVLVMLGRSGENRRPPSRWFQMYRGQHQPARRGPRGSRARLRPALPAAAARSGTRP